MGTGFSYVHDQGNAKQDCGQFIGQRKPRGDVSQPFEGSRAAYALGFCKYRLMNLLKGVESLIGNKEAPGWSHGKVCE